MKNASQVQFGQENEKSEKSNENKKKTSYLGKSSIFTEISQISANGFSRDVIKFKELERK